MEKWADIERTTPRLYRTQCKRCHALRQKSPESLAANRRRWAKNKERYNADRRSGRPNGRPRTRPLKPPRVEEHIDPQVAARLQELAALDRIFSEMSREDKLEYRLEGCLPMARAFTLEDLDPTPVPTGCPGCYLHGGNICDRCPDSQAREKVRTARAEGRIIGSASSPSRVVSVA